MSDAFISLLYRAADSAVGIVTMPYPNEFERDRARQALYRALYAAHEPRFADLHIRESPYNALALAVVHQRVEASPEWPEGLE